VEASAHRDSYSERGRACSEGRESSAVPGEACPWGRASLAGRVARGLVDLAARGSWAC
jgi:hypothetical protein